MKLSLSPAPLVPMLADVRARAHKHDPALGFRDSDLLHIIRNCEDRSAGQVLPVLGYCICFGVNQEAYAVRVYVPGRQTTSAGREALRFPTALETEVLFVPLPAFITEIDVTDSAHCLALERVHEAVVIPMYASQTALQRAA
ncbi:hypothetical protein LJ737_04415 [Hymenobacter sp. 15J16-1T3B]|uniref:hypothetical protein n=1 Tax=Hymenobacter sp. 15J16-1T3B TaxID=2886941 RepID=UPI001D1199D7|nr:hypothetical protein [Hymenobacter sp. 15J16-1T3B]MCC3156467.1 hypothetical protein [Hymenobacter sp. 15J16-1T3B]